MQPATRDEASDPTRWGTIFGLLSLDMVAPWVEPMGLELPREGEFRKDLRELIEAYRMAERSTGAPAVPFYHAAFRRITSRFGDAFARHLFQWGTDVFCYGGVDNVNAFLWRSIVLRANARQADAAPPSLVLLCERLRSAPPKRPAKAAPESAWDVAFFQRHGYDADYDPIEWVRATLTHAHFVAEWQLWRSETTPPPNMEEVDAWGRREAGRLGMPTDKLGPPGVWPGLPERWCPEPS